jgi:hypothetical protein
VTRAGGPPRPTALVALALAMVLVGAGPGPGPATDPAPDASADAEHQLTVFGIEADPKGKTIDPKLAQISAQLQRLRPDHGFTLWGVKSARVAPGATVRCPLRDGQTVEVQLAGITESGKVRLAVTLRQDDRATFGTTVITPPNQLFFCERPLPNGARLLIGIGAR